MFDRAAADFFADFLGDTSLRESLDDGRQFLWKPQSDITAYELSLCMYLLIEKASANSSLRNEQKVYDSLPAEAQRHFAVIQLVEE